MHLEIIGFSATAPGPTGASASAFTGDSLTVKNSRDGARILTVGQLMLNQTAGFQQIVHPSGHDTTRGYRQRANNILSHSGMPFGFAMPLQAQELLAITVAGSATAGDVEQGGLLIFYEDSPFINANLITLDTLKSRTQDITTVAQSITTTAGPGWTGSAAINAQSDLLRANTDYAILGLLTSTRALAVGVRAPDFGGQRVGIPCEPSMPEVCQNWFPMLAKETGLPLIPVFNSANRANVLIDAAVDENAAAQSVSLILAQLK